VGSYEVSLRKLTSGPCEKEDIVEEMDGRKESAHITAASAACLNYRLELTASSVRSCLAPASDSGSCLALDASEKRGHFPSKEVNSCKQG
jgi:hypothetical protein